MAEEKNIAKIERKDNIIAGGEGRGIQEAPRYYEKEKGFESPTGNESENKSEIVDDLGKEEEFGSVQPIGGFQSKSAKRQKEVEDILSRDLQEIYLKLPPNKQYEFKTKGEETAREINGLLDRAKFEVGKIVDLIRKWLLVIPGLNKFFIEQEAKIKTDEILKLKDF